jgi:hypothetical protein
MPEHQTPETVLRNGGAVLTLPAEVPRHPELRDGMTALMPNLRNAADTRIADTWPRATRCGR